MNILFAALHLGYFRNFESAIRELAGRGHHVHLAAEEAETFGGEALARRLGEELHGRVTWDVMPSLEHEPWFDAARRMRVALDYVRALEPRYPDKLRLRAPVLGEDVTICRHGQELWAYPASKIEPLLQAAAAAKKLPKPDPKFRLEPFALPIPEKQLEEARTATVLAR